MGLLKALDCGQPAARPPLLAHPTFAAFVWAGASVLASYSLRHSALGEAGRLTLALLPVGAFLYFIWAQTNWFRRSDELQQRIQLSVWVHAFVLSMLGAISLHYLRKAGFFTVEDYPGLDYYGDVLPYAFIAGMLLGYFRAAKRYF